MVHTKEQMLSLVDSEIEDRIATANGWDDPTEMDDELQNLDRIKDLIAREQPLAFTDYQWFVDIASEHAAD